MEYMLPDRDTMYRAFLERDDNFEGIFYTGVRTTGIFCRPGCGAKKPKKENVEFFGSAADALHHGYRPCKLCNPMGLKGELPGWLMPLFERIDTASPDRIKDRDLLKLGVDPNRVRRWFKINHGMTFQAYLRALRLGQAFGRIKHGENVIETAFDSGYESLSGFTEAFKRNTGFSPEKSRKQGIMMITRILTPLGPMFAAAVDEGICLLEFTDRRMLETQITRLKKLMEMEILPGDHELFSELSSQLVQYFEGNRKEFTLPLSVPGTPFQKKVWSVLRGIPYGQTISYKEQAKLMGKPEAVRAVARANGENRIAVIIPCHRVIGADGSLTGYGGGLWRKRYLLNLEKANA
jgi:AraC family transcriptional regulator of adaptative response/methylated-DNA-[protein]-cysteine methyltransferase